MEKHIRFSIWYFAIGLFFLVALRGLFEANVYDHEIKYSAFKNALTAGQVSDITLEANVIRGDITSDGLKSALPIQPKDNQKFPEGAKHTFSPPRVEDPDLIRDLIAKGVSFTGTIESPMLNLFVSAVLPLALMVLFWQFLIRRMASGHGAMSIGKSKAKVYVENDIKTDFDDVAGIDEAVEELREVVAFLKTPEQFTALGGRLPKGILLVGPPGTGKTLLARAVAGQAKVPFFSLSGSEFVEMFVGVGAARVRDLFEQAQKKAPCIIFIDELDALGRARGMNPMASNEEREQTLNQLLTEMDGFDSNHGVVLMAATNRPEILDPALLRAGRFDRHVVVDRPDIKGRDAILRIHLKKVKLDPDVEATTLAARTPGFVGADLANVVNEAALLAARMKKTAVDMADFEESIDRVIAGLQKKSSVMTPDEKHRVAIHEAGHAVTTCLVAHADPIHKVSIIPRGIAGLGFTMQISPQDRHLYTRAEILDRLAVLLGGRIAEELIFNDVSTGAADDLQKATQLARSYIIEYGMSKTLGTMAFNLEKQQYLSTSFSDTHADYGIETANAIDSEVRQLLADIHARVTALLSENKDLLKKVSTLLEQKETISGDELKLIVAASPYQTADAA